MEALRRITVLYDATCGLCGFAKDWIRQQDTLVGVGFVAAGSEEARRRFPQIPAGELAVVGDAGEVWWGDRAWIVCLWALRDYRELAIRLSAPGLLTMARQAFAVVSKNRLALSRLIRLRSAGELEQELREVARPQCEIETK